MTPRNHWAKRGKSKIRESRRHTQSLPNQGGSGRSQNQTDTVQPLDSEDFPRLHDILSLLPQTDALEPLHQENDTLHPEGPTCKCLQPCFLHQFPPRVEYAQTLDDLSEIVTASDNRFYHYLTESLRRADMGGEFPPYPEYPPGDDVGGPFKPDLSDKEFPRYRARHYLQEPLVGYDDFVVSMGSFFAGYRDGDAKRSDEIAEYIENWDVMWDKISCAKQTQDQ